MKSIGAVTWAFPRIRMVGVLDGGCTLDHDTPCVSGISVTSLGLPTLGWQKASVFGATLRFQSKTLTMCETEPAPIGDPLVSIHLQ